MSGPSDGLVEQILAATTLLSRARVDQLLAEATGEAETEVKALLKSAIKASVLGDAAMKLGCAAAASPKQQSSELAAEPNQPQAQECSGCYVYCITTADAVVAIEDLQGVERAAIQPVESNGLQALVSAVPLSVFQAQALR